MERKEAAKLIETKTNAVFKRDITYDTNYLVATEFNTSKAKKAAAIGVAIISEKDMLRYIDKGKSKNKSHFEITYASIIKIDEQIKDRKIIEKIILCDVQKEIYPNLEKVFINLLSNSGFRGIKFEKKVDFEQLYNQKLN